MTPAALAKLRPAAWIAGAALAIHALFLLADWTLLAAQQRGLRGQMEARFRGVFPDAVAVADPALQMRRQLAVARNRAGIADGGDFAPMMEKVALALKELPAGALRSLAYEGGRIEPRAGAARSGGARAHHGAPRPGRPRRGAHRREAHGALLMRVRAALIAVLAALAYVLVVHFADRGRVQLTAAVATLRTQAARLDQQAAEHQRLRATAAPAASPSDLRALVQARVDAARLSGALTRIEATDADHVNIAFGAVPFAEWLGWVAALQAQHVRLETARVEALAAPGLVSVSASLARSRAQ